MAETHSLIIQNALGTVTTDFDIIYRIESTNISDMAELKFWYDFENVSGSITPSYLLATVSSPVASQNLTQTITMSDIQAATGVSSYPSDGAHKIIITALDSTNTIIAQDEVEFVWSNNALRIDLGEVTAYAAAVRGGFTGDFDLFCKSLAIFASKGYLIEQLENYEFLVTDYTPVGLDKTYYGLYNGNTYVSWSQMVVGDIMHPSTDYDKIMIISNS